MRFRRQIMDKSTGWGSRCVPLPPDAILVEEEEGAGEAGLDDEGVKVDEEGNEDRDDGSLSRRGLAIRCSFSLPS
jgi:hypothetical protein